MDNKIIKAIYIYNINQKDKIIGKLKDISRDAPLANIRPQIKKMTDYQEFIKFKENGETQTINREVEEDFCIEDILLKEIEFKIFIKDSNNNSNNINNNNFNINNMNNNFNVNNMNNFQ